MSLLARVRVVTGSSPDPAAPTEPVGAALASSPEGGAVLDLRSAAVRVGGRTLWRGVDLTVGAGEFVSVLGPNGVGKSTLIKVLLGALPTAAGTVAVLGRRPGEAGCRIGDLPPRRRFDAPLRIPGGDRGRL